MTASMFSRSPDGRALASVNLDIEKLSDGTAQRQRSKPKALTGNAEPEARPALAQKRG